MFPPPIKSPTQIVNLITK